MTAASGRGVTTALVSLATGTTTTRTLPVKVLPHPDAPSCPRVVRAAAGERHSVAACSNGYVLAWGYGGSGQLGRGRADTGNSKVPVRVSGFPSRGTDCRDIISLAAGAYHTLAVDSCNQLYTWGYNRYGQLCDNTTVTKYSPVRPTNLAGTPVRVAAGDNHSFIVGARPGIRRNDLVLACGRNSDGQLGDGSTGNRHFPVLVTGLPPFDASDPARHRWRLSPQCVRG
jgi:alpha-tubulin suppressor-like RCC1 family protein